MSLPAIGMSAYFGLSAISQYAKGNRRLARTCAALSIAIIAHQILSTYSRLIPNV